MPAKLLTDVLLRSAKPGAEIFDARTKGLCFRITPAGAKGFSFRYQLNGSKKFRRVTLGAWPAMSLVEARDKAAALRDKIREGDDPAREREARVAAIREVEMREALTVADLVKKYLDHAEKTKRSWKNDEGFLRRDVVPAWGDRAAASITQQEVATRLREIAERTPIGGNRVRSVLLSMFGFAAAEGLLAFNPVAGTRKPHREAKEGIERYLSDPELRVMWRQIEAARLDDNLRDALFLLALTGARAAEITGLRLHEIHDIDDGAQARIELPSSRTKQKRRHVVPLSPPAVLILRKAIARRERMIALDPLWDAGQSDALFQSRYSDVAMLARHSLSHALRRILQRLECKGDDAQIERQLQQDRPTPHALRRTLASGLSRLGTRREVVRAVLGHSQGDVLAHHYDSYELLPEKREALRTWGAHVGRLLAPQPDGADVVPLAEKRR